MDATFFYGPKLLQSGELKNAFEQAALALLGPKAQVAIRYPRRTGRAGVNDEVVLDAESLRPVVDLGKIDLTLTAAARQPDHSEKRIWLCLTARSRGTAVSAFASGEESVECLDRIALSLGLKQIDEPKDSLDLLFKGLESRVLALEKLSKDTARPLRCFISFKFDDKGTAIQADRLKRLLAALRIEWVTGEQFEPRRIEDKVKSRLRADVDFIVAVISKAGESKWIRDELADANARGLRVVVLLEVGASFDKGIFGALEYIPYDLTIEQTFPALLEGVNFIKAEISTRGEDREA
jgi:hypothetical protein